MVVQGLGILVTRCELDRDGRDLVCSQGDGDPIGVDSKLLDDFAERGRAPGAERPLGECEDGVGSAAGELYRAVIRSRRDRFGDAPLRWIDAGDDVLAFERGGTECWVNAGPTPVPLPAGTIVLLASEPADGDIPPDTAVYLRRSTAC